MLKSLLLDRMKRKRSSSIEAEENSKKAPQKVSKPVPIPEQPQDILRKRLLGWVDPPVQPEKPAEPQQARRSQERPAKESTSQIQDNYGQVFHLDLNQQSEESSRCQQQSTSKAVSPAPRTATGASQAIKPEENGSKKEHVKKENTVTYANTSVLKHLLHRYTEMNQ